VSEELVKTNARVYLAHLKSTHLKDSPEANQIPTLPRAFDEFIPFPDAATFLARRP
jgi:hypothetical protein